MTSTEPMLIQINRATMIAEERGCTIDQIDNALSKFQQAYRETKGIPAMKPHVRGKT